MKKIILTALLLALFSTSAMAAVAALTGSTTIGSMVYSSSNNVYLNGAAAPTTYFFESLHKSGSRTFATDHTASVIYWKDTTGNADLTFTAGTDATTLAADADYVNKL